MVDIWANDPQAFRGTLFIMHRTVVDFSYLQCGSLTFPAERCAIYSSLRHLLSLTIYLECCSQLLDIQHDHDFGRGTPPN
jgi:hypothetical protein